MTQQQEALRLLEEALKELESAKGSVLPAVQKLMRAAILVDQQDIRLWCSIQLGEHRYVSPLKDLIAAFTTQENANSEAVEKARAAVLKKLEELGLKQTVHFTHEELNIKAGASGGGYHSIGFIEERYADLVRTKRGNDGTYYKSDLNNHLNYVKRRAHGFSSALFNKFKFSGTVRNCFDVLKTAVDDKLLDLIPALAEQLMLAFKAVSSAKEEEWSQALTTCRRLLEGLADQLHPASSESVKGRGLGQGQYVNRLWAFMDVAIESESNKELAKAHVDFLGAWLEKANKITNKGVHAEVQQLEAVKAIFHTYLVVADLLEYLKPSAGTQGKRDINTATLDEIEALLDVNRATAKAIVKARVENGKLDKGLLKKIRGVGPKTLEKAVTVFEL